MTASPFYLKIQFLLVVLLSVVITTVVTDQPCVKKQAKFGIVCVCNDSYCDSYSPIENIDHGYYYVVQSTKQGDRLVKKKMKIAKKATSSNILTFNSNKKYQKILGFGGAFTDAATLLISNVSSGLRRNIMNSYYSTQGNEYTMGRVPIGSTDFSIRTYTYDDNFDKTDFSLGNFSLVQEDLHYKIPIIQLANKIAKRNLLLVGTPWTAPAWMKTNNKLIGKGKLKGNPGDSYYKTWANYFIKFLDTYAKHGVNFWGVTTQNEPTDGNTPNFKFQCMGFIAESQRDFIKQSLGPAMANSKHSHVNIIILDDNRPLLPKWANTILDDPEARKYVKGIGVHWYLDVLVPVTVLNVTHYLHPDVFLLGTEACAGTSIFDTPGPSLGSWARGVKYSSSIIDDLNNFVVGWLDWNLAVNASGGPNWVNNNADSPIIIDVKNNVFYKEPMFYHLAHFSKYVKPGATRISVDGDTGIMKVLGVVDDKHGVVVILNPNATAKEFSMKIKGGYINMKVQGDSIQTYIFNLT